MDCGVRSDLISTVQENCDPTWCQQNCEDCGDGESACPFLRKCEADCPNGSCPEIVETETGESQENIDEETLDKGSTSQLQTPNNSAVKNISIVMLMFLIFMSIN